VNNTPEAIAAGYDLLGAAIRENVARLIGR
jgi:hypothetical protein